MRHWQFLTATFILLASWSAALAQLTDSSCQRKKLAAVGQLTKCRVAAWRRADRTGDSPDTALLACDGRFNSRWQELDSDPDCLTTGDASSVHDEIASCMDDVAARLTVPAKVMFTTAALFYAQPGPGGFTYTSGADMRCQMAADAVSALQGKSWKAWISGADPNVAGGQLLSAASRISHSSGAYVRPDGVAVASNFADLVDGSLLDALNKDEHGLPLLDNYGAWTGTLPDGSAGTPGDLCRVGTYDWNTVAGGVTGLVGNPAAADTSWTDWQLEDCGSALHLFCVEQ